jgi:hypothetical protein
MPGLISPISEGMAFLVFPLAANEGVQADRTACPISCKMQAYPCINTHSPFFNSATTRPLRSGLRSSFAFAVALSKEISSRPLSTCSLRYALWRFVREASLGPLSFMSILAGGVGGCVGKGGRSKLERKHYCQSMTTATPNHVSTYISFT